MTIGQLIKAARKKAGMTQLELAQRLQIPFQSVSQWERGLRNPKPETIEKIASAIGVDYMDLVPQKLQGPYFAAYMLRHPEITVEDEHGNIIIQGTGRTWDLSSKPEINVSGENDFQEGLKKVAEAAQSALEPPKIAETKEQLFNILEELSYEELETLVKFAQFTKYQREQPQAPSEPPVAPSCNEDPAPQSPSTISGRKDPAPPDAPEGPQKPK